MFRWKEVCEDCVFWQKGYCDKHASFTKSFNAACRNFIKNKNIKLK